MQNAIIVVGAIAGLLLGGWFATHMFHESGALGAPVMAFSGAMPGAVAGAWIALKVSQQLIR